MATTHSEVKRWQLRLYGLGLEVDNSFIGIRDSFPLLPPIDPQEMEHQRRMRIDLGIYTHLAWLIGNELHILSNLGSIREAYDALEA